MNLDKVMGCWFQHIQGPGLSYGLLLSMDPRPWVKLWVLALPGSPQVQQRGALLQKRVWVLHPDLVDVVHTELELTG